MIVVSDDGGLLLVAQEAHAHLAGDLAARLPAGRYPRSALVAAARQHDNGWREADADPTRDDRGRPRTFYDVPPDVYESVWRRGIVRAVAVDPLVGLLVGLHGARFFGASPHAAVRALHEEERDRQDRVLADLGLGGSWQDLPPPILAASDWIAFLDRVSLLVCGELPDELDTDVDRVLHRTPGAGTTSPSTPGRSSTRAAPSPCRPGARTAARRPSCASSALPRTPIAGTGTCPCSWRRWPRSPPACPRPRSCRHRSRPPGPGRSPSRRS